MGWIDYLKDVVKGLRATGKSEQEIEKMVSNAADKATVTPPVVVTISAEGRAAFERQMAAVAEVAKKAGTDARDAVDAMSYAVDAMRTAASFGTTASLKTYFDRESNNWRKMHGLPMRRKRGKQHGRTGSSHRH